jgi:hypothetical protein
MFKFLFAFSWTEYVNIYVCLICLISSVIGIHFHFELDALLPNRSHGMTRHLINFVSFTVRYVFGSVADPVCLSRILIFIYPGSKNSNKRGGGGLLSHLFCSQKYHKIENYFAFELVKKKI